MVDGVIFGSGGKPDRWYLDGQLDRVYFGDVMIYPEPPPAISSLSPSGGSDLGGTTVTITGTNFTPTSVVKVDGTTVSSTYVSATSMTFVTPAHAIGSASVTVTSAFGTSNAATFTYSLITLSPLVMTKSGTFTHTGSSGSEQKVTGWGPGSETSVGDIVDDELVVNGDGNITVTLNATRSSSSGTSSQFRLMRNGIQVATSGNLSFSTTGSASWTGNSTLGDRFSFYWYKGTGTSQSCSTATLGYVVN